MEKNLSPFPASAPPTQGPVQCPAMCFVARTLPPYSSNWNETPLEMTNCMRAEAQSCTTEKASSLCVSYASYSRGHWRTNQSTIWDIHSIDRPCRTVWPPCLHPKKTQNSQNEHLTDFACRSITTRQYTIVDLLFWKTSF